MLSISPTLPSAIGVTPHQSNVAAAIAPTAAPVATSTSSAAASAATAAPITASASVAATATATVNLTADWFAQQGSGPYLLNASNTTYVLQTDITVPGTAFIVGATNVTLDLNQHTVTYGASTPVTVLNGSFEQGTGRSVPGWDLSAAPSAAIGANDNYLWGNQVLKFTNITGTQSVLSDAINIPTANHEYTATVSVKTVNGAIITLSVIDSVTGAVLGSSAQDLVQFTPTTKNPVRLKIEVSASQADTVELDYASLTTSRDFGVVTGTASYYMPPQLTSSSVQQTLAGSSGTTIKNGSLLQGQGNGYMSLPIYAEYARGLTVQGVNTMSTGIDTGAIDAKYPSGGLTVSGCVFKTTSDKVTNRMAMMGALVQVAFSSDAVVVDNNQFIDSPQIGVFASGNSNLKITNNTIKSNSIATDGYGILCNNVQNFVISGNTITAAAGKSSRGILMDGYSGVTYNGEIFDNYVDIRERPNPEYGAIGLEATALRLRTWMDAGMHDVHIYNNTFIARTGDGEVHEAIGLRAYLPTNTPGTNLNILVENNTFKGIVESSNSYYYARAVSLEEVGDKCSPLFKNNIFESNDTSLGLGGNDGKDAFDGDFISNTFSKSSEGAARTYYAVTAGFWNGSVENVQISDPKYANGASETIAFLSGYAPADGSTRTVSFGGVLSVSATNTAGGALSGAKVTVLDKNGVQVFSGVTDSSGQAAGIPLPATTYTQSTTNPSTVTNDSRGPFQVTVSLAGYTTATQTVTQPGTIAVQLPPSGTTVTVNAPSALTATAAASNVSLSWTDNATNATSYSVERLIGSTGAWSVVASNLGPTAATYTDSNVTAGTTYTYRVRAFAGSTASGYSNVASATVPNALPNAPAAPTNLAATAAASSVSLSWTNNATNATAYSVERSTGSTGTWTVIASNLAGSATSYTDASVTAGASYSYRVQAFAGTTGSSYSNVASATVPSGTTTTPAAPTNLSAAANTTAGGISLAWTNNATNATSYAVERFSGGSGLWTVVVDNLPGTATNFVDNTVTPAVFYTYRVRAFAGTAPSAYSNATWATAPNVQPTTPAAPTNLTATASPSGVALSWANNAANATAITVERSTGTSGTWSVLASNLAASATSYNDTSVTAGASYSYRVTALSGTVASPCSNVATVTVPSAIPAAPTNLAATASPSGVALSWTNNAANATAISIERSTGTSGTWSVLASNLAASATSYNDTSVAAGASYSYRVTALSGTVASPCSNVATVTVPSAIPAAPTNLAATASPSGVALSWTNNAANATAISIERFSGGSGLWTVVTSNLAGTATSYVDSSVTPGVFYTYRVQAFAGGVSSPYSNSAWATAPTVSVAAPTNLTASATASPASVSLSWTNNATNATAYTVERSTGTSGTWAVVASNLAGTATSYVDTSVAAGTAYSYRVKAIAGTLASSYSNVASATVPATTTAPAAPTNLVAVAVTSPTAINLSWKNNATNATSYRVERFSGGTGLWTVVATLPGTATSYVDKGVKSSTYYTYRVQALAGTLASAYSNTAWATTRGYTATAAAPTSTAQTLTASTTTAQTLAASATTSGVKLSWGGDNTSTSYVLERYNNKTGLWDAIANVTAPGSTYIDLNVTAGTSYSYRVRTVGSSTTSNVAPVTIPRSLRAALAEAKKIAAAVKAELASVLQRPTIR